MLSTTQWIFIGVAIIAYYLLKPKKKGLNLPGPITNNIPLLGSMVEIDPLMYTTFDKWSKKYGAMFKVHLGLRTFAVISDPKMAREMLALDAFAGRDNAECFTVYEAENIGLIASEEQVWEEQRRFVLRQLRDFGFAKSSMESMIREEADELVERLSALKGHPIEDFKNMVSLAVVNSLWTIVAGTRYSQDDPKLRKLAHQMAGAFDEALQSGAIVAFIPWLKHIIPEKSGYNSIRRVMNDMIDFVSGPIKDHRNTLQDDSSRDFIDVYLKEMQKTTDPSSSFYGSAAEKQLIAVVVDLFQAGTDTTSTTLSWAILHLMDKPEIQRKMQHEITQITGDSRPVALSDRPNMPYTLAVISELLRISIAPIGVPHRALSDTEFRGVFFPKGTGIIINLHYIHHDPKLWDIPDEFMPERFLSADGKTLLKNENLNPFLAGRRQCPGETLARDTTFLMLTSIVQNFDILKDPKSPKLDFEPVVSLLLSPKPFKTMFVERKK